MMRSSSASVGGQSIRKLPRFLLRILWAVHRAIYRASGSRIGLSRPTTGKQFGMLRLTTIGRRSGRRRVAIIGYFEDGPNLITLAMNGWTDAQPAWWLNLQGAAISHRRPAGRSFGRPGSRRDRS